MLRNLVVSILSVLALGAMLSISAYAQAITTHTFATLPGSPTAGQLAWLTDNSGTATEGSPVAGGAPAGNRDLVAYDAGQARWEFVLRVPATAPEAGLEKFIAANRIDYDNTESGAAAEDVQAALDELFASPGGGGGDLGTTATGSALTITNTGGTPAAIPAATTTTWGAMADEDKAKLDGIEAGATADQNSAEVSFASTVSGWVTANVRAALDFLIGLADPMMVCKTGFIRGGGLDVSTGLYQWTCAGDVWTTGETYVDCTGEATISAGTDGRCWAAGERLMVDETLEAFMLAHDATMPGGTIYVPLWPGEDHAIYVYEECDGDTCPLIQQGFSDVRKNLTSRTSVITTTHGRRFVAESSPRVDPVTRRRSGVWLIDNTNDGTFASGDWVFRTGMHSSERLCIPTSATDPTCNVDSASVSTSHTAVPMSLAGVRSSITVDAAPATSTIGGHLALCMENTITANHSTTRGVCQDDPRIRCTVAGNSARLTATTGGCDFGAGGDLGPCVGFVDYLQAVTTATTGGTAAENVTLAVSVTNFLEDGTVAGNGSKTSYLNVESVPNSPTCDTDSKFVLLGKERGNQDFSRHWPFDADFIDVSALTLNDVQIVDMDAANLGTGYSYENFGFAPNNYFRRDSSLASADCTVGTESECDKQPLVGFMAGFGGGHKNTLYWGCSDNSSKSCIDGITYGIGAKIHDWEADNNQRGLLADLSRWDFRRGYVHDSNNASGLFQLFVSGTRIGDLYLRNNRAPYAFRSANAKNLVISDVIVDGFYAQNGLLVIDSGMNITAENFQIAGLSGHGAVIGADSESDTVANITLRDWSCLGPCVPFISSGFSEPSKSFISISQFVIGDNTAQGALENIQLDRINVDSSLVESMLLHLDIGDDNELGGETAQNRGQEPYFDQIRLTNSSINSTSGLLVGAMGSSVSIWDAADVTVDYRDGNRRPSLAKNRLNGVLQDDWDYPTMTAAQAGDAGDKSFGAVVAITDDTAVGACTDAGADGILDGGGSSLSVCKANPAGNAGNGAWSPF